MYFYTEAIAKMKTQMNEKEEIDLPPFSIHQFKYEVLVKKKAAPEKKRRPLWVIPLI